MPKLEAPKSAETVLTLTADGVSFHAWVEPSGDIHLVIDGGEVVAISPSTASILGLFLLSKPEED